jgi:uncharacterized protein with HEPN domain
MKDPRIYLAHIGECIERIRAYTSGGESEFQADPMIQDAVIRNLEVIGEAAKRIPDRFREANPTIPWRGLAGLRDVLIHQYEGVDLAQVWRIVASVLPDLDTEIRRLVPDPRALEEELT